MRGTMADLEMILRMSLFTSFISAFVKSAVPNISVTTKNGGINNILLSELGAFPENDKSLRFQVKGNNDAQLLLMSQLKGIPPFFIKPYYLIIIGGWNNSRSTIETAVDEWVGKNTIAAYDKYGLLSDSEYRDFWVTWEKGNIRVGTGNTTNMAFVLEWKDPCPFAIRNIAIKTVRNATVDWILFSESSNDVSRKEVPKNMVTIDRFWEIKCPTYEVIHKVIGTRSILQCGALCIEREECNGFQLLYNKTNVCELVSDIVIDVVMSTLFMLKY